MNASVQQKFKDFEGLVSSFEHFDPAEYRELFLEKIQSITYEIRCASDSEYLEEEFYKICKNLDVGLMHERCREKPLGYAGDYLMIDWIYTKKTAEDNKGKFFDEMFHTYEAAEAVRNRKSYFINKCEDISHLLKRQIDVLNIGCGPCRDVFEFFQTSSNGVNLNFHCVDQEPDAIAYAEKILEDCPGRDRVQLECTNIFRLKSEKEYDLIWSAGLFDYLNERTAAILLKKVWRNLKDGGKIIFGNFSPKNPTRPGMDYAVRWRLIHRTAHDLIKLVEKANLPFSELNVESESLGVNLFCVITK